MFVAATVMLGLAAKAAFWGSADLNRVASDRLNERARTSASELDRQRDGERVLSLLEGARALAPGNADYAFEAGRSFEAAADREQDLDLRSEFDRQALAAYEKAIALRPTWGRAWMFLAARRYREYGLDEVTLTAIEQAQNLGPWELDVLEGLAKLGMQAWAGLPPKAQPRMWKTIQHAARERELQRRLLNWSREIGWAPYLRRAIAQDEAARASR
jgi:hypothetical protein